MFHYFLRRTEYIYLKLCWDLLGISSMVKNAKKRHRDFGLGWILPIFVCQYFMLLYFLRIIQYFFMKFCTVILGIIVVVYTLKQCPRSAGGHFWVFWGPIFAYVHIFSRYPFYILSWNFEQVFLVWPWLSHILFLTSHPHLQGVI